MSTIVGRDAELEAIEQFLDRSGFRAFVIEGEAGIGKTTIWNAGVEAARERGYRVLACRPAGSEVQLSFAALGDLLDGALEETATALPAPQQQALEVALLRRDPGGASLDQRAIAVGALGLLRVLARSGPVLVAVDDAQWLDVPTAAVLEFVLRRLRDEPIALLAAVRMEARRQDRADLGRALPEERQSRLRVGPLSAGALHGLIRSRLDIGLPRPLLLRVHETSGGNPFYALELARALESTGGHLRPGDLLLLPASLQELVHARLAALPDQVQKLLLAVALLSDPRVSTVEATGPRARSSLKTAVAARMLELDGERIAFTHPLLASAVYSEASVEERRRMHRRLAAVVEEPESQARHLALGVAGPDAAVAAALDEAARRALARGAPNAAAQLLELAIAATPAGEKADLRRRKLEAADALVTSGGIDRAVEILRALLDELPAGDERAEVVLRLAEYATRVEETVELGRRALREATRDDVLARAQLALGWTWLWRHRHIRFGLRHGRLAVEHAERSGERRLVVETLAHLSLWEFIAGRTTPGLLERAIELHDPSDGLRRFGDPRVPLAIRLRYCGKLNEARVLFDELIAEASRQGDELSWLLARAGLVDLEWRAGNWQRAAAYADSMYELAEQIGFQHDPGFNVFWKALIDAHMGRVTEARAAAEFGAGLARTAQSGHTRVLNLSVLGIVELSLGREAAAERHFRSLLDWSARKGLALAQHPSAPYALEALVGVGKLAEARKLIARFEREATTLESPWGLAIAARLRGLLAAAQGDMDAALAALEQALGYYEGECWPFEHARTLLALGRTQRRAKQKAAAKQSLEQALALFEGLPAPLWAERTREELQRLGLRRAAPDELTEAERRVAELAASGLKNREVAAQLFLSPKTVEANLARAYRKLGIHSRAELGARLASAGHQPAQT